MGNFNKYTQLIKKITPFKLQGVVKRVVGVTIESNGPNASVGEICLIKSKTGKIITEAEVVGFNSGITYVMPFAYIEGIRPGCIVEAKNSSLKVSVGEFLKGRILDGLGRPIDGMGINDFFHEYPVHNTPPDPLKRDRIKQPIATGVKAIDSMLTVGQGQRMGIFAGSGVGKSVLMGMLAKYSAADVNVIALVGERGREVKEFMEKELGEEGLKKSVLIVATSDKPALIRLKAPFVANAIAEYFRDQGKKVLLMMDSLTRIALAQREIGLAIGEPPATRGFPPSMFALMPKILERAGNSDRGSITGFYTVLVEGDDMDEPVADTVRGVLDGHIVLSRELANMGHFPAIDVLKSISRVMDDVVDREHKEAFSNVKSLLAVYEDAKDLISLGAYSKGSNPKIDRAISVIDDIQTFLRQDRNEYKRFDEIIENIKTIHKKAQNFRS